MLNQKKYSSSKSNFRSQIIRVNSVFWLWNNFTASKKYIHAVTNSRVAFEQRRNIDHPDRWLSRWMQILVDVQIIFRKHTFHPDFTFSSLQNTTVQYKLQHFSYVFHKISRYSRDFRYILIVLPSYTFFLLAGFSRQLACKQVTSLITSLIPGFIRMFTTLPANTHYRTRLIMTLNL